MGIYAEDEVHRFTNRRGLKSQAVVHKCHTCKKRIHFITENNKVTYTADNVNGVLSKHVCKMTFKRG